MNKKILIGLSVAILGFVGIGATSCTPSNGGQNDSSSIVIDANTIAKLKIKSLPDKLKYSDGEAFSAAGLKVILSISKNGQLVSEQETSNYTLSIKEGTILHEGEYEVFVQPLQDGIRSTSFNIVVELDKVLTPLIDVVNTLVKDNNYTVNNTLAGTNHVTGLMTKDALIWLSDEEAYFMDEGYGYGRHDDKTFRYKIVDDQIQNAVYISDLGGKAQDHGLFSIDTVDNMAERRISNYNIQGITEAELNYLAKDCKPLENNPNKYPIDINYSKWLFNAIGHTQLTIRPDIFLKNGGKIFIEVKDYGLDIDLITSDNFDGVKGCVAQIKDIGTTIIPGMDEFMKNPTFTQKATNLEILQTKLNEDNYQIDSSDGVKNAVFSKHYAYGKHLEDIDGVDYTLININKDNKLGKPEGYYHVSVNDNNVLVKDKKINKADSAYLVNFGLFENLGIYFVQDETMPNRYKYVVNKDFELTSDLESIVKLFITNENNEQVKEVNLELIMAGDEVFMVSVSFEGETDMIGAFTISKFGKVRHQVLDKFIKEQL